MGVFEHFPYTNFHELNLDWVVNQIKELKDIVGTQIVDLVARAGVAANTQAINNLSTTVTNNATTAHNEAQAAANAASTAQTTATNAANAASAAQTTATNAANAASANATNIAKIGKKVIDHQNSFATGTTLAYTGETFTITKNTIVTALLAYTASAPKVIAIADASSGNIAVKASATDVPDVTNREIHCTTILEPGTYYVWAKSASSGTNRVWVFGYTLEV